MEKTGVFIVVCWINQTCSGLSRHMHWTVEIQTLRKRKWISSKRKNWAGFCSQGSTRLPIFPERNVLYAIVHARRNVLCISLLTSYARDKYIKNPLNLMISIKHKYNVGVFYTTRAPGVHVHAWGLNISPFLYSSVFVEEYVFPCVITEHVCTYYIDLWWKYITSTRTSHLRCTFMDGTETSRISFVVSSQLWRRSRNETMVTSH